jgi:hypothetical protein
MNSSEQLDTNLPAILGLIIGGSWLLYNTLLVANKKNIIKVAAEWFNNRRVVLPALATQNNKNMELRRLCWCFWCH